MRVTDAVHQANSMHFVYATSDRALHFYDASATVHLPEYEVGTMKQLLVLSDSVSLSANDCAHCNWSAASQNR